MLILAPRLHYPLLPIWIGIGLCLLSPIIVAAAVRSHRVTNNSVKVKISPSPDPAKSLVDCGIYAYVRHPMYLAAILLLLGAAIWRGSLFALGYVILAVVFLEFKASHEERMLLQTYSDYAAYRKRTGRLLPRIRR